MSNAKNATETSSSTAIDTIEVCLPDTLFNEETLRDIASSGVCFIKDNVYVESPGMIPPIARALAKRLKARQRMNSAIIDAAKFSFSSRDPKNTIHLEPSNIYFISYREWVSLLAGFGSVLNGNIFIVYATPTGWQPSIDVLIRTDAGRKLVTIRQISDSPDVESVVCISTHNGDYERPVTYSHREYVTYNCTLLNSPHGFRSKTPTVSILNVGQAIISNFESKGYALSKLMLFSM